MKYLRTRITEVLTPAPNYKLLRFAGDEPIPAAPRRVCHGARRLGRAPGAAESLLPGGVW